MSDAVRSERSFRTLNCIDEFNREVLRIEVDTRLPVARVIRAFNELVEVRGAPLSFRLDNGPEFITDALAKWAQSKNMLCSTSNLENRPRTSMSNAPTRPTAPRCGTVTCSSRCRKCAI